MKKMLIIVGSLVSIAYGMQDNQNTHIEIERDTWKQMLDTVIEEKNRLHETMQILEKKVCNLTQKKDALTEEKNLLAEDKNNLQTEVRELVNNAYIWKQNVLDFRKEISELLVKCGKKLSSDQTNPEILLTLLDVEIIMNKYFASSNIPKFIENTEILQSQNVPKLQYPQDNKNSNVELTIACLRQRSIKK